MYKADLDDLIDNENNNLGVASLQRNITSKLHANPNKRKQYIPIGSGGMIDGILKAREIRKGTFGLLSESWQEHVYGGVQNIPQEQPKMYNADATIQEINASNSMLWLHPDSKTPFNHDGGRKEYARNLKINLNDMQVDLPKDQEKIC